MQSQSLDKAQSDTAKKENNSEICWFEIFESFEYVIEWCVMILWLSVRFPHPLIQYSDTNTILRGLD